MTASDLTQDQLLALFEYDPVVGDLIWRVTNNVVTAGSIAGYVENSGYVRFEFKGIKYSAHRAVWIMHNGEIPAGMMIDHRNGIKFDNEIDNLRLASRSQNSLNRVTPGGVSGYKGVTLDSKTGRWRARATIEGVRTHIGMFDTEVEASAAYETAAKLAHGEFYYES